MRTAGLEMKAQKVVGGDLCRCVVRPRQLRHHGNRMLEAQAIGKPEPASNQRTRRRQSRKPVPKTRSAVEIQIRNKIGRSESPAIVPRLGFNVDDSSAGMSVPGIDVPRLYIDALDTVDVDTRRK